MDYRRIGGKFWWVVHKKTRDLDDPALSLSTLTNQRYLPEIVTPLTLIQGNSQ